jgi:hypothetical protein
VQFPNVVRVEYRAPHTAWFGQTIPGEPSDFGEATAIANDWVRQQIAAFVS